jgi:hypothetical protein
MLDLRHLLRCAFPRRPAGGATPGRSPRGRLRVEELEGRALPVTPGLPDFFRDFLLQAEELRGRGFSSAADCEAQWTGLKDSYLRAWNALGEDIRDAFNVQYLATLHEFDFAVAQCHQTEHGGQPPGGEGGSGGTDGAAGQPANGLAPPARPGPGGPKGKHGGGGPGRGQAKPDGPLAGARNALLRFEERLRAFGGLVGQSAQTPAGANFDTSGWFWQRDGWVRRVRAARSPEALGRQLRELARHIEPSAFDRSWRAVERSWSARAANAHTPDEFRDRLGQLRSHVRLSAGVTEAAVTP